MGFSEEDKILIKNLHLHKGYGSKKLINEFPCKQWSRGGIEKLLKKLRDTGSTDRKKGSGRPKTSRTQANVRAIEMALKQENSPQTHQSIRQMSIQLGIPKTAVWQIINKDLGLKCKKKGQGKNISYSYQPVKHSETAKNAQKPKSYKISSNINVGNKHEEVFTLPTSVHDNTTHIDTNMELECAANVDEQHSHIEKIVRSLLTFENVNNASVEANTLHPVNDLIASSSGNQNAICSQLYSMKHCNNKNLSVDDEDYPFLLSFVIDLKTISDDFKSNAKSEILQVLKKYKRLEILTQRKSDRMSHIKF